MNAINGSAQGALSGTVVHAPPLIGTPASLPGVTRIDKTFYRAPIILVAGREKDGKCQSGNALILDPATGLLVRLEDLVKAREGHVSTLGLASVMKTACPTRFVANGRRSTFRVTTESGRTNEATDNHPFLTRDGWRELKMLKPGDRVAIVTDNPVFGASHGWFREVPGGENASMKLLAYLIADGDLSGNPVFTKNEDEVRDEFMAVVQLVGDDYTEVLEPKNGSTFVRVKGCIRGESVVVAMLRDVGLAGKLSAEKFIPARVFGQPNHRLRLFLNRLFTCDGSYEAKGVVSYSSTSQTLVRQVQHLLTRYGIYGRIRPKYLDGALYGAELRITSRDDVLRFIDEIGFFGEKQARAQAGRASVAAIVPNPTQTDRVGPIVFDRIASIEPCGEQEVYDLTVEVTHNFVADDFVVHNSSLATSLFGFPEPHHQPLILAVDPSGPDSCLNLGFAVHAIRVNEQAGATWHSRMRSAVDMLERNITSVQQQYGSLVVDCGSTLSYRLLEDQRRTNKNPDPRSHYFAMYNQFNEIWWRLTDLGLPVVWLAWTGEPSLDEKERVELAAPDIAGKRFARTIAGRAQHVFVLEKRLVGLGGVAPTPVGDLRADALGYARLLHTTPWNKQNAGGRFGHLLPEPCPADLSFILRAVRTGAGPK